MAPLFKPYRRISRIRLSCCLRIVAVAGELRRHSISRPSLRWTCSYHDTPLRWTTGALAPAFEVLDHPLVHVPVHGPQGGTAAPVPEVGSPAPPVAVELPDQDRYRHERLLCVDDTADRLALPGAGLGTGDPVPEPLAAPRLAGYPAAATPSSGVDPVRRGTPTPAP